MSSSKSKKFCKEIAKSALPIKDADEPEDLMDLFESEDEIAENNDVQEDGDLEDLDDDDMIEEENLMNLSDNESLSDEDIQDRDNINLVSPSGRKWIEGNVRGIQGRASARNLIQFRQGPKPGINPTCEMESVMIFLEDCLSTTVIYSNLHGRRIIARWNRENPSRMKSYKAIDLTEMKAFVGLLILQGNYNIPYISCIFNLGAFRARYRDVYELWGVRDGIQACRATMTVKRFMQIKSILRFDDPLRRDRSDSLAPCRFLFDNFNKKLSSIYTPSEYLTIDEQLLEFHGNIKFKQYIASKPGKFGIKIIWVCDAKSYYMLNGIIYIGKGTLEPNQNLTTKGVTLHLMKPFLNTGRHLTADNWFSSIELVDELKKHRTTFIGTVRNNNRGIPPVAKSTVGRNRKDNKIYHDENGTMLVSFWDKGTKPVLLFDSFHPYINLPEINQKSSTVMEYNATKSGVDIADKLIRGYSCKRKCRRWPFSIFSNMIDIATNNGSIIFHEKNKLNHGKSNKHYTFLVNAAYQLIDEEIKRRIFINKNIKTTTKEAMLNLGYAEASLGETANPPAQRLQKSKRCNFCETKKDRKTYICCSNCQKPMCNDHRSLHCITCQHNH